MIFHVAFICGAVLVSSHFGLFFFVCMQVSRGRPLSSGIHGTILFVPLAFLDEGKHTKHPISFNTKGERVRVISYSNNFRCFATMDNYLHL